MTQPPDELFDLLLDRVLEIAMDATGIQSGTKHLWELPGNGPFPRVIVYIQRNVVRTSPDYITYDVTVGVRLLGGSIGAGYSGAAEDTLNRTLGALFNRFNRNLALESPQTREQFRYITGDPPSQFTQTAGNTSFMSGNPAAPERHSGMDFQLEVQLRVPRR